MTILALMFYWRKREIGNLFIILERRRHYNK